MNEQKVSGNPADGALEDRVLASGSKDSGPAEVELLLHMVALLPDLPAVRNSSSLVVFTFDPAADN